MPTLNWIGKDKVVNHHLDVPYRILEHKYGFRSDDLKDKSETHSGNMIIHGDNLEALKSLMPEFEGKIDCVYIDPPYNTGEESWVYNDNVNDPHILNWLNNVVGKEGEDLSRHDKWLCMIYPRLMLLYKLLSNDGTIFISIDDNECFYLKVLCDYIFGRSNFIANFIWEKRKNRENRKEVSVRHDYILCYAKCKKQKERSLNMLNMTAEALSRYSNPDNDPNGPWKSDPAHAQAGHATESQIYTFVSPNGTVHELPVGRCWVYTQEKMAEEVANGHIWLGANGSNAPRIKTYLYEKERGLVPETMLFAKDVSTTEEAKKFIKKIFNKQAPFGTPKPVELIQHIIKIATNRNSIILDSFAGSGATAHAVLAQNNEDKGNRKFILVELMDYADTLTAERTKKVITGYNYKGKKETDVFSEKLTMANLRKFDLLEQKAKAAIVEHQEEYDKISKPKIEDNCLKVKGTKVYDGYMPGLGGSFDFYELGNPIFDKDGNINSAIDEDKVREYVFYTETRSYLTRERSPKTKYLLDTVDGVGYYFYYEKDAITTLCKSTLGKIVTEKAEQYIIYANCCTLSKETLAKYNIVFKKISSEIKRF